MSYCAAPLHQGRSMLELQGIEGGYGGTTVLRDVSLSIPPGSVVALLGPNGAGKSTTMRMASGLLRPRRGRVLLDGNDVTAVSPSRRARLGICHVMEGRSIFPSLSVRENLLLQAPPGASKAEIMDRTNQEFPQLTNRGKQLAGTLSGGEQQMLALMRAYLAQPRVVLVDEASLGLAPVIVDHDLRFPPAHCRRRSLAAHRRAIRPPRPRHRLGRLPAQPGQHRLQRPRGRTRRRADLCPLRAAIGAL